MKELQLSLTLDSSKQPALTLTGHVREILLTHEWLTPYELQKLVQQKTGEWHSDSAITARLRDLRKVEYGSHVIEKRRREGSKSYEYRLAGVK